MEQPKYKTLEFTVNQGQTIGTLSLNRPNQKNALSSEFFLELP